MGPNPAVTPGMPRTAMDWPITPDALYWAARFLTERYHLPIIVTENGMANIDFVMSDGAVHDPSASTLSSAIWQVYSVPWTRTSR